MNRTLVALSSLVAAAACKGKAPAEATPSATAAPAAAPATPAWTLRTRPVELACEDTEAPRDPLGHGRALGKEKRWGEAVAAFERVLTTRKDDPAALSELTWAALQAGDVTTAAAVGERALAVADAKLAPAVHYNAGRAAEAMGDLAGARRHYEASLATRPNPTVQQRLAGLAAPAERRLSPLAAAKGCRDLPAPEAICGCLAEHPDLLGGDRGLTVGECELAEPRGATTRVIAVRDRVEGGNEVAGTTLLVAAQRPGGWAVLDAVDAADSIDLDEEPRAVHIAQVVAIEERPFRGGTLIAVQSQNLYGDRLMGDDYTRGEASLSLCVVPAAASEAPTCFAHVSLGAWRSTVDEGPSESGESSCEEEATTFVASIDPGGELQLVLDAGVDDKGRVGRYRF